MNNLPEGSRDSVSGLANERRNGVVLEERIRAYFKSQGFVADTVDEADRLLMQSFRMPGEYLIEQYTARLQLGDDFVLDDEDLTLIADAWPLLFYQFPVIDTPVYVLLHQIIRDLTEQVPDRPLRILDAGCGVGISLGFLAAEFPEHAFAGYDREEVWVEATRRRIEHLGLSNVTLTVGEHEAVQFANTPFDLMLCVRSGGVDAPCCPACEVDHQEDFTWSLAHYEINLDLLRIGGYLVEIRGLNHFGLKFLRDRYQEHLGLQIVLHHFLGDLNYEITCHQGDPISVGVVVYEYAGRPTQPATVDRLEVESHVAS